MISMLITVLVVALVLGLIFYALSLIPFLAGWPLQVTQVLILIIFILWVIKVFQLLPI